MKRAFGTSLTYWLIAICCQITYAEGDSLAKSFLETIKDWPEPAELSKCAVMRWSCSSDCQIVYSSKNFVSYVITYQEYTGGAHNNYKTRVGTLMKGKQLRLKNLPLNITTLWEQAIAKHFKAKSYNDYLNSKPYSKPFITENFYLDAKGIHFIYDPYEIDSFAAGTIDIFVPIRFE